MKVCVALLGLCLVFPAIARAAAPEGVLSVEASTEAAKQSAAEPVAAEKDGPIKLWMGEDVALRYSPAGDHRVGVLAGVEAGWMPLSVPVTGSNRFMLGPGVRAGWGPMWHLSAVLRLAVSGNEEFSPRFYLQGGPLLMRGTTGADFQAGVDWLYGGGFVGAILEPQGDGRRAWTVVIGARVALVTIVASALVVNSLMDLLTELFDPSPPTNAR